MIIVMRLPDFDEITNRNRSKNWHKKGWAAFLIFILNGRKDSVEELFQTIFSNSEQKLIVKKFVALRRLQDRNQYREIQNELGLSSQTISDLSKSLQTGKYVAYDRRSAKRKINVFNKQRYLDEKTKKPVRKFTKRTKYGRIKHHRY